MFKKCSNCGYEWETMEDFLQDSRVVLAGYQAHFEELHSGLLMFNHDCNTTISFYLESFRSLHDSEIFSEQARLSSDCPGHCMQRRNFEHCPVKCECNYLREIVRKINEYPKNNASDSL